MRLSGVQVLLARDPRPTAPPPALLLDYLRFGNISALRLPLEGLHRRALQFALSLPMTGKTFVDPTSMAICIFVDAICSIKLTHAVLEHRE